MTAMPALRPPHDRTDTLHISHARRVAEAVLRLHDDRARGLFATLRAPLITTPTRSRSAITTIGRLLAKLASDHALVSHLDVSAHRIRSLAYWPMRTRFHWPGDEEPTEAIAGCVWSYDLARSGLLIPAAAWPGSITEHALVRYAMRACEANPEVVLAQALTALAWTLPVAIALADRAERESGGSVPAMIPDPRGAFLCRIRRHASDRERGYSIHAEITTFIDDTRLSEPQRRVRDRLLEIRVDEPSVAFGTLLAALPHPQGEPIGWTLGPEVPDAPERTEMAAKAGKVLGAIRRAIRNRQVSKSSDRRLASAEYESPEEVHRIIDWDALDDRLRAALAESACPDRLGPITLDRPERAPCAISSIVSPWRGAPAIDGNGLVPGSRTCGAAPHRDLHTTEPS